MPRLREKLTANDTFSARGIAQGLDIRVRAGKLSLQNGLIHMTSHVPACSHAAGLKRHLVSFLSELWSTVSPMVALELLMVCLFHKKERRAFCPAPAYFPCFLWTPSLWYPSCKPGKFQQGRWGSYDAKQTRSVKAFLTVETQEIDIDHCLTRIH